MENENKPIRVEKEAPIWEQYRTPADIPVGADVALLRRIREAWAEYNLDRIQEIEKIVKEYGQEIRSLARIWNVLKVEYGLGTVEIRGTEVSEGFQPREGAFLSRYVVLIYLYDSDGNERGEVVNGCNFWLLSRDNSEDKLKTRYNGSECKLYLPGEWETPVYAYLDLMEAEERKRREEIREAEYRKVFKSLMVGKVI